MSVTRRILVGLLLCAATFAPSPHVLPALSRGHTSGARPVLPAHPLGASIRIGRRSRGGRPVLPLHAVPPVVLRTIALRTNPYDIAINQRLGLVYVTSVTGGVTGLDAATGMVRYTLPPLLRADVIEPDTPPLVAVDEVAGLLYVSNSRNGAPAIIGVFDARTGALRRRLAAGLGAVALALDARAGRLYVMSIGQGGRVHTFDTRSGAFVRALYVPVSNNGASVAVDARRGRAYIGTDEGVSVVDARTGTGIRPIPTDDFENHTLAVDDRSGSLVVAGWGARGSDLSIIDARNRHVLHATDTGDVPDAVAVDAVTRRIFASSSDTVGDTVGRTTLHVLDVDTGAVVHTGTHVGADAVVQTIDPQTGRVYLTGDPPGTPEGGAGPPGPGQVTVLDGRDGAVLRRLTVGPSPSSVALDGRTRRAFVVNQGAWDPYGKVLVPGSVTVIAT